jgi:hypothetical protein
VGVPSYMRDPQFERKKIINEKDFSLLRYGLLQKGSRLLQKRKERKTEEETKKRGERERQLFGGEKERKIEFFSQPLPSEIGGSFVVRS